MDKAAQIKALIKSIVDADANYPVRGTVESVDGQTCSVKLVTGLVVTNVRLKAVITDTADYLLITPKVGSDVLMLSGNGTLDDLTVIKTDQAQSMELSQGGLILLLDGTDSKVTVKNNNASLVDIFGDLADLLKLLKVTTPMGPSGVPLPDTITALEQWQVKVKQLLK
ncbi:hypothetical protein Q765_00195 [Flavobacterium rivuli WB 3.3-2 = DSM 21788]|uniref:Uncharacterized protein n=1 Tax=Flavobacterium rivuli WB 3.3-2 = DSM 21788 TaxID=1121895 RepID=A0A0A2M9Q9_9FLAO|nr:hypothetical protein [Flavobacterium rivuli]KGO88376.1 hypothetical protein Q765_00195 [Flavobacterium rivuli WB 3.3-2 = DSM 21788]